MDESRPKDIDYAAVAVRNAIEEKFGRKVSLSDLQVTAQERTITLCDKDNTIDGTRDLLLAAVREAVHYDDLWRIIPTLHARQPK